MTVVNVSTTRRRVEFSCVAINGPLEGRMEGTRTRWRLQSATMIDWMKSNDAEYEYDHIKKRAYDREDCRHWMPESEKADHTRDSIELP